jgi:hypothetical protein
MRLIPRIPHLPGSTVAKGDLTLSPEQARPFLSRRVEVNEKMDGISITVGISPLGELEVTLRPPWAGALGGEVHRAANLWGAVNADLLRPLVAGGSVLFGEWLWHRLSLRYRLPSPVFLLGRYEPRSRSIVEVPKVPGLYVPAPLFRGVLAGRPLESLCRRSQWGRARAEGLVLTLRTRGGIRWAKWVRPGYEQPMPDELDGTRNEVRLS